MKTYTVTHTAASTILSSVSINGGFKDITQFEFNALLTETEIDKVYVNLALHQKEAVGKNKQGFKQFVRAIMLAHPAVSKTNKTMTSSRADEGKRLACRTAKILGLPATDVLKNVLTVGTINQSRFDNLFVGNPNSKFNSDEQLVYNNSGDILITATKRPITRGKDGGDLYVYVIFTLPNSN